MTLRLVLGIVGAVSLGVGIWNERMMQRHRLPGVTYGQVTLRRDGGWRRRDLFSDEGLRYQRRASAWGFSGLLLCGASLLWWAVLR